MCVGGYGPPRLYPFLLNEAWPREPKLQMMWDNVTRSFGGGGHAHYTSVRLRRLVMHSLPVPKCPCSVCVALRTRMTVWQDVAFGSCETPVWK